MPGQIGAYHSRMDPVEIHTPGATKTDPEDILFRTERYREAWTHATRQHSRETSCPPDVYSIPGIQPGDCAPAQQKSKDVLELAVARSPLRI